MGKKHTSYRGQIIDMEMVKYQNEHTTALGNAKMNARGDKIGVGGTVIKTREELLAEKEREMQVPDIVPEHTSHSSAPAVDDGFDDSIFEIQNNEEDQSELSTETSEKVVPVKRAKVKKTDQE